MQCLIESKVKLADFQIKLGIGPKALCIQESKLVKLFGHYCTQEEYSQIA